MFGFSVHHPFGISRILPLLAAVLWTAALPLASGCGGASGDDLFQDMPPTAGDASVFRQDGGVLVIDAALGSNDGALHGDGAIQGDDGGSLVSCPSEGPLHGLTPTQPVDYMEFRTGTPQFVGSSWLTSGNWGSLCASATNRTACSTAFEQLRQTTKAGWTISGPPSLGGVADPAPALRSLLFTRGDTVRAISSLKDLGEFLAPIDAPKEAALLASQRLYGYFQCGSDRVLRHTDGSFEVRFRQPVSDVCKDRRRHETTLVVRTDGTVSDPKTKIIELTSAEMPLCGSTNGQPTRR